MPTTRALTGANVAPGPTGLLTGANYLRVSLILVKSLAAALALLCPLAYRRRMVLAVRLEISLHMRIR